MRLAFTKMHGLGNDFVVVEALREPLALSAAQINALADRRKGVGFDQLLVVEPARRAGADLRYRVFNADGSEAEHCGNGARCFARYVYEHGISRSEPLVLETGDALTRVRALGDDRFEVDMGVPELQPQRIPFEADQRRTLYPLQVGTQALEIVAVSLGNPHAVLRVHDVQAAPVAMLGPRIEHHPRFPRRANVGFWQLLDTDTLAVRVWERGVGETPACGTGACAAVVAARLLGAVGERVGVQLTGGRLEVQWPGEGQALLMTGPTASVFEGEVEIPPSP